MHVALHIREQEAALVLEAAEAQRKEEAHYKDAIAAHNLAEADRTARRAWNPDDDGRAWNPDDDGRAWNPDDDGDRLEP